MPLSRLMPYLISPILAAACAILGWLLSGRLSRFAFHSFVERIWFYIFLGIVAFSWIGTILASLGAFKGVFLAIIVVVLAGYSRWPRRTKPSALKESDIFLDKTPWVIQVIAIAASLGIVWLYARPAESFLLTDDSSVYTIGGISLARSGSLWLKPDMAWSGWMPGGTHVDVWQPVETSFETMLNIPQGFLRQFFTEGIVFTRHYGPFYQWSLTNPSMEIGFLALPKVWPALVTLLFGAGYAPFAAPFMGLVALGAVYLLIRRTLGWPSACVGVAVLAVSFPQLWFARLSLSEIYTQLFFIGGLYLLTLVRQNLHLRAAASQLAALAGITLAVITVVRFEALLMLMPLVVLMLLNSARQGWEHHGVYRVWLWTLVAASLLGTIFSIAAAPYYIFTRLIAAASPDMIRRLLWGLVGIMCLAIAMVVSWGKIKDYIKTALYYIQLHIYHIVLALWLGWAVLAVFQALTRPAGSSLAGWLGQYYTWQGLLIAVLGCLGLLYLFSNERLHYELAAFLGIAALFIWLYSYNPRVTTVHPWAMRRLIPVVIPALVTGIAAVPWCLQRILIPFRIISGRLRCAITTLTTLVVTLAISWGAAQVSRPFVMFQERGGMYQSLARLAAQFPPKSLLLFDDSEVSQLLTPVMELVFNHPSLVIYNDTPSGILPLVDTTVENALKAGYQVFYIEAGGDPTPWNPEQWSILPYYSHGIVTRTVRQNWGRPPIFQDISLNTIILEAYQVVQPMDSGSDFRAPIEVPVSDGALSYLYDGFNQLESEASGQIFRWTDGHGQLRIPWPGDDSAPISVCLQLEVSGGRPAGQPPTKLTVQVEDKIVLEQELLPDFTVQTLKVSVTNLQNKGDASLEISLDSSTFDVFEGEPPITRTLGVMFYGALLDLDGVCR